MTRLMGISFCWLLISLHCFGQIDAALVKCIDSMVREDERWRFALIAVENKETDSVSTKYVWRKIALTGSLNFPVVRKIFHQYGYPGKDKLGDHEDNFWLLVQHSDKHPDFQDSVLQKM